MVIFYCYIFRILREILFLKYSWVTKQVIKQVIEVIKKKTLKKNRTV